MLPGLLRRAVGGGTPLARVAPSARHVACSASRWSVISSSRSVASSIIWVITSSVSSFDNFQIAQIGAYVVAIAGLSVLTGLNGQISLGHGALMGIGAYAAALLMIHTGFPLIVVLVLAAVAAGLAGADHRARRGPAARPVPGGRDARARRGSCPVWPTAGPTRSAVAPASRSTNRLPPTFLGTNFDPQEWIAWISAICAVITLIILANLIRSRFGRSFRTVRDDEIVASLAGIHVARTQLLAFVVSAACAGLGGALLALSTGTVNPLGFPLSLSIALVAAMVIGGLGSLTGAIWGGILVVYLPQWATSVSNDLGFSRAVSSNLAFGFYGLVLVLVMLTFPGGIQGGVRRILYGLRALASAPEWPWFDGAS